MTIKNGDLPASPTIYADMGINGQREIYCDQHGLTKREIFAMAAMQGILSNRAMIDEITIKSADWIARRSCIASDALLSELERTK